MPVADCGDYEGIIVRALWQDKKSLSLRKEDIDRNNKCTN